MPINTLKNFVYPLIARFFIVIIMTIAISLGLALITYALEEKRTSNGEGKQAMPTHFVNNIAQF